MSVSPRQRSSFRVGRLDFGNVTPGFASLFTNAGTPTSGTSGTLANIATKGSLLADTTNGVLYVNRGTKASPTWVPMGSSQAAITAITASGAIAPGTPATYVITKAGVAAMTIAAPTATTHDGVLITVTSFTANAHTVTATGLLYTGGAATDVATFNAQKGASLKLMAYQAKLIVLDANGVSFS